MKPGESTTDLRYLDAGSVRFPEGNLSGFRVFTEDDQVLGSVHGVLISPASRQLRYFVIEQPGFFAHRRYLLPVEAGAIVQGDNRTLQIDARKDELELEAFRLSSVRQFSDGDLLEAMFSHA